MIVRHLARLIGPLDLPLVSIGEAIAYCQQHPGWRWVSVPQP